MKLCDNVPCQLTPQVGFAVRRTQALSNTRRPTYYI
jgi:hypothetical protein